MRSRIPLITGLIASLLFAGAQQAQAADSGDVAIGVAAGAILGSVLTPRQVVVYEQPRVHYAPPPPVYYPAPVYVERPVYYSPGPVIYVDGPRYHHKHWKRHHRHHHRHHGHGHRW
ncbi:virulence factor [Pseudomonas alcaligenes]|uniref:Virulence factor n=1 Tax=Aquipseudomonas alcaligenes TaxID=43263 RepID=A0A2V4L9M3_AQUAC|nr:virulence factor [Pseudomonas alcaligenes]PYC28438.1 virulence factor [Pseudomonas alcaligenes]